jgi:O-antigen/teichoic acid export membrane protein
MLGAVLISYLAMASAGWLLVSKRFVRPRLRIDPAFWRSLLREALPVGVAAFLFLLYTRLGTIVLEVLRSSSEVGLYNAALSLPQNLGVIAVAFSGAVLPTISRFSTSDRHRLPWLYVRAFKLMFVLGLPMATGGLLLADEIVQLVYGAQFVESGAVLRIVIWSLLFFCLNLLTGTVLQGIGKQALWTYALAAGVVVNLCLDFLLVPSLGMQGAGWALLVADAVIFVLALLAVSRHIPLSARVMTAGVLKPLISAAIMGMALISLSGRHLVVLIPVGAAIYCLCLHQLRALDRRELTLPIGTHPGLQGVLRRSLDDGRDSPKRKES